MSPPRPPSPPTHRCAAREGRSGGGGLAGVLLRRMARAAGLRALVGIEAAGRGRRVAASPSPGGTPAASRGLPGWPGFCGVGCGSSSSSSFAPPRMQARRAAGSAARTRSPSQSNGWITGGSASEDGRLSWGYSSFKGRRPSMEDRFSIKMTTINEQTVSLFGVFDGHGGSLAAEYLKEHLFENLVNHPELLRDTKLAISQTFLKTDADFLESVSSNPFRDDGSTAVTAILVGNHLYVGNVGDSRVVALKAGKAVPLSEDHKPNRKDEQKRIEDAGGIVVFDDTWRVNGLLAMSRAFGNRALKHYVKAEPDIQEKVVDESLEYLILATDGLWDVMRNEDAVSLLKAQDGPKAAAMKLTEVAHSRLTLDNITCIVLQATVSASASAMRRHHLVGLLRRAAASSTSAASSRAGPHPSLHAPRQPPRSRFDGDGVGCRLHTLGHGGPRAAEYLKKHLFKNLVKHPKFLKDTKLAINQTFLKTDADFLQSISSDRYRDDGSTAVAAILIGNRLYVANVGDSRAVALKAGKAVPLSEDHKPNKKDERKRIEDAGGIVVSDDIWRVDGILAVSRAFGNRLMKRYVKAEPDIQEKVVDEGLEYLVLATDGLWDVMRNEDAVSLLKAQDGPKAAAMKLTEVARSRLTLDNITCIVLQFHHGKSTNSK
uniref:protein-serine/threonine phosphatase n=1 Tax=Oryza barthii TaxID=65489 RepID=A0A0D3GHC1_9ORYZ